MKDFFDDYDMTREDPAADLPGNADPVDMEPVNEEEPVAGNGNEGVPGADAVDEEEPAGIYRYKDLFIAMIRKNLSYRLLKRR